MKKTSLALDVFVKIIFWLIGLFFYPAKLANTFLDQPSWILTLVSRAAWFCLFYIGYHLSAVIASRIAMWKNGKQDPTFKLLFPDISFKPLKQSYSEQYSGYILGMIMFLPLPLFLTFYGFGKIKSIPSKDVVMPAVLLITLYSAYYLSSRSGEILAQIKKYLGILCENYEHLKIEVYMANSPDSPLFYARSLYEENKPINSANDIRTIVLSIIITSLIVALLYALLYIVLG